MKNLSGWSLLWITLSVLAVIGTIFQVIQYKKRNKEDAKKADATTPVNNSITAHLENNHDWDYWMYTS